MNRKEKLQLQEPPPGEFPWARVSFVVLKCRRIYYLHDYGRFCKEFLRFISFSSEKMIG
jgi:hypothetical protein